MKFAAAAAALVLSAVTPGATSAQSRVPMAAPVDTILVPGAKVLDSNGGDVGTIVSVAGDAAVIDTGTNKVGYPVAAFGSSVKGLTVAVTKADLDTRYAEQVAKATTDLTTALVPGTAVRSRNGTASVGTIKAVDAEFVTLTTVKGDIRFPRAGFSLDPQGVIIGFTADEFNAAIGVN